MACLEGPHREVKAERVTEPGTHTFIRVIGWVALSSQAKAGLDRSIQTKKNGVLVSSMGVFTLGRALDSCGDFITRAIEKVKLETYIYL